MTERVHPVCTRECTHNLPRPPDDPARLAVPVYAGPGAHRPAVLAPPPGPQCAACGYAARWHELGTLRCPEAAGDKNGRRGKWRDAPPVDRTPWRDIMRRDAARRAAEYEAAHAVYVPEVAPPPLIAARAPHGPGELAGYGGRQAVGLGRKAIAAGWAVAAYYAMRHDAEEFCAIKLERDDLYAVATWTRKPGKRGSRSGWEADIAYGVRRGDAPVKLTHTQLEGVITT
jgi:hypothetical protein